MENDNNKNIREEKSALVMLLRFQPCQSLPTWDMLRSCDLFFSCLQELLLLLLLSSSKVSNSVTLKS